MPSIDSLQQCAFIFRNPSFNNVHIKVLACNHKSKVRKKYTTSGNHVTRFTFHVIKRKWVHISSDKRYHKVTFKSETNINEESDPLPVLGGVREWCKNGLVLKRIVLVYNFRGGLTICNCIFTTKMVGPNTIWNRHLNYGGTRAFQILGNIKRYWRG